MFENDFFIFVLKSASSDDMQLVRDSLNSVRRFLHSSKSQRDAVDTLETSIASLMHRLMSAPSPSSSSLSSPDSSNHFPPRPLTSHSTPISHHPPHTTGDVILTPSNASLRPDVGHTSTPARNNLSVPGKTLFCECLCILRQVETLLLFSGSAATPQSSCFSSTKLLYFTDRNVSPFVCTIHKP